MSTSEKRKGAQTMGVSSMGQWGKCNLGEPHLEGKVAVKI